MAYANMYEEYWKGDYLLYKNGETGITRKYKNMGVIKRRMSPKSGKFYVSGFIKIKEGEYINFFVNLNKKREHKNSCYMFLNVMSEDKSNKTIGRVYANLTGFKGYIEYDGYQIPIALRGNMDIVGPSSEGVLFSIYMLIEEKDVNNKPVDFRRQIKTQAATNLPDEEDNYYTEGSALDDDSEAPPDEFYYDDWVRDKKVYSY